MTFYNKKTYAYFISICKEAYYNMMLKVDGLILY